MRVAVYPGSFDPLHIGHLAIIKSLLESGDYDIVYLIVSPQNPLKDASKADNAEQRFEAAREAMRRQPELRVKLDDIELKMPAPHYTIRTLEALKKREADNDFTLVMGADNLAIIEKWKDSARILEEFGVAVFPRKGSDCQAIKKELEARYKGARIRIIDAPMVDISSTEIRENISRGRDMTEYII